MGGVQWLGVGGAHRESGVGGFLPWGSGPGVCGPTGMAWVGLTRSSVVGGAHEEFSSGWGS